MYQLSSKWITRGIPAVAGAGLAWIAVRMIKNEARLVLRELELKEALVTNSWKEKKRLLEGK